MIELVSFTSSVNNSYKGELWWILTVLFYDDLEKL